MAVCILAILFLALKAMVNCSLVDTFSMQSTTGTHLKQHDFLVTRNIPTVSKGFALEKRFNVYIDDGCTIYNQIDLIMLTFEFLIFPKWLVKIIW